MIVSHYELPKRHYHNLNHVGDLVGQINRLKLIERDRQILLYSAFYHDVVYLPGKTDNELKSAEIAEQELNKMKVDFRIIKSVVRTILATKNHISNNELTRLFLDMDMCILASDERKYRRYLQGVEKENNVLPKFIYRFMRKRFIQKTLKRSRIFLTDLYLNRYELVARTNLLRELNTL